MGSYTLEPNYSQNGTLLYYAALRGGQNGIEHIIRADQLNTFISKVDFYTSSANWFYLNGIPSKAMIQTLAGNRITGLFNLWADALSSPTWWAYAITTFGHAITTLPVNTPIGSTYTTVNWRQSMKSINSDLFQGKTVTNPQGTVVSINIPDNFVPSITIMDLG